MDGVLERRLQKLLDTQLIEAHLKLDTDQLSSRKVKKVFAKVVCVWSLTRGETIDSPEPIASNSFMARYNTIYHDYCDVVIYTVKIDIQECHKVNPSKYRQDTHPFLSSSRFILYAPHLPLTLAGASSYEIFNKAYHRLNLMKNFAMENTLRRDISVTNLEPWLLSEFKEASQELGDTPTKAPYLQRTSSQASFVKTVIVNLIQSSEYIWLIYEGFRRGMTLGTLHLIRSSTDTIIYKMYDLVGESHRATDDWKDLIAFFRCLEYKSEMANLEPKEYVSNPAGMKLEARKIRYKYDEKSETEVLKGASFVINPGEMIAVVGYSQRYFTNSDSMVLENRLLHDC